MAEIRKKISFSKVLGLLFLIILIGLAFTFWPKPEKSNVAYTKVYRLVEEKISQNAAILINLPKSIKFSPEMAQAISFQPEILGKWVASTTQNQLIYQPKDPLVLNHYYQATLALAENNKISADFMVVEDPAIIAIFPNKDSEANEYSDITIVFNRPMVPLTTLSVSEAKDLPVEITPKTEGHYKWITTSNLKFIPKERLLRSSNYKVTIKSGLVSMDNLSLKGAEVQFQTRPLRYIDLEQNTAAYNQPVILKFNQAVDLEKIKKEIAVTRITSSLSLNPPMPGQKPVTPTGESVPILIQYRSLDENEKIVKNNISSNPSFGWLNNLTAALKLNFLSSASNQNGTVDKTTLEIYGLKDRFGRAKMWDANNNYKLVINKAYPEEGDIILNESRQVAFNVTDVVSSVSAESDRTSYAQSDFFDPRGKLWISFYEDMDLNAMRINSAHLKETGYGEKCKDANIMLGDNVICEKTQDKKRIYLTFKEGEIKIGDQWEVSLEKIVNIDGLSLNKEPYKILVKIFPVLENKKMVCNGNEENCLVSSSNTTTASLTRLMLCTNTPLIPPAREDYRKSIILDNEYEVRGWQESYRVEETSDTKCPNNWFITNIVYGLMPQTNYVLNVNMEDVFGQKNNISSSFKTGDMPYNRLGFFHLQKAFNVTTSNKTKLTYAAENWDYADLEICRLSAFNFMQATSDYYDSDKTYGCEEKKIERIDLPKKYWVKNYFDVELKKYFPDALGHYIITLTNPNYYDTDYEDKKTLIREKTFLSVTNLSVVEKKILPDYQNIDISQSELGNKSQNWRNLYWVTNLSDLNPAVSAKISLYQLKDNNWVGSDTSYNTDSQGLALTGVLSDLSGAIVTSGLDSTVISPMRAELNYASSASIARRIYVYTDRPIYRPSHTVFLKGISRIGYDGSYEVYRQKKLNLKVVDPQGKEMLTQDLEINKFGTFNTKLVLPDNAALGGYSVCIDYSGCTFFDVEEYVPAPFEIKLSTDKEEYISKEDLKMKVDANYYFGVPLSGGDVEYTLSSQNYYFDRYQDTDDKTYYEFNGQAWTNGAYEYGDRFILRNNATLDEKGKAAISQSLDTTKLFSDVKDRKSKILVFDVTAKNKDGQSVSSQKSLIMHAGDFYIGLNLNKYFLSKNEKGQWKIKTVDTNGKNVSVKNIDLSISKIDWVYQKRQGPSGGYEYIWDRTEKNVKNLKVNTGANGQGAVDFQLLEEGEYEAHAKAIDGKGNEINNYYSFYVYGSGSVAVMNTDDSDLEIKANKTDLKVGERGSVIIKSPWAKAKALITLERGKIYSYEVKEITGNLYEYGFEAKAEYFPNIFLSATLISSEPGVKFGSTEFKVNTDTYKLNINVNPDKKTYLPGEEVNAGIQVTDVNGLGKSAEVSLAVVDASVLALKGNPKKDPMAFFYNGFPLTVSTASNIKNVLKTVQIWGSETSMASTKGGGGGSDLSTRQRGEFKDTAYWQAVINTDSSGKAQIKFKLPDNLTTWQLETIAVTEDTKLGAGYTEIMAKKNLMVVPLKPRFAISGDTFYIGAQVFNQTGKNQKINVSYQSDGLILKDDKNIKTLSLANGANETVYFKVQAPSDIKEGTLPFVLLAKTGAYEDSVAQNLKITADNSYESVATANFTSVPNYREYIYLPDNIVAGKGGLKLTASATLANYLSDSLNYLMEFPYGCTEQIASQLKTLSVLKSGLNIPNVSENVNLKKIKFQEKEYTLEEAVDLGLNKLYQNQNWDGGFDYWSNQGSGDYHLTLYVLDVFSYLQKAGFNVKSDVKTRAIDYVYNKLSNDKNIESNRNNLILTLYILDKAGESKRLTSLKEKVIAALNDKAFLNERISSVSLAQLALMSNNILSVTQKNAVYKVLNNRMEIDSRGAYLASGIVTSWEYYETSIKNTALYLKVMSLNQLENPISDKVLRWLLASRAKDGSWGSTNNTISVIDAFSDYLKWKKETEANFNFSYALDGKEMGTYEFNKKNIFNQYQETLPMSSLPINKIGVLDLKKTDKNVVKGTLYYDMALKYYLPIDQMPPRDEGFSVMRNFYALSDIKNQSPLISVKQGEVIRAHVEFVVPKERNFVMLEDYIPAGMELVNMSLATSDQSLRLDQQGQQKQSWEVEDYGSGQLISPIYQELKDDRIFAYFGNLSPGVYKFDYYARALIKGNYSHLPAQVLEMYYPENFGRNAGSYFEVK